MTGASLLPTTCACGCGRELTVGDAVHGESVSFGIVRKPCWVRLIAGMLAQVPEAS